ncbi:thrombospondin type-1 domain-containing protein 7B [Cololabis saira]|uniref:thrombospondin type-1 domain-containing protein 7B n=1 Tax=Cololabis saira TaxID=129043 RepID=UPI002AD345E0|nr:thrombospondin type-1 domain-containing protein 7B [Cololabis saira]
MGWTMTLKDDFGVITWTWQTMKLLSLFLFLSLFSIPVPSENVLSKDHHFSWKPGQWGQCIGKKCGSGGVQTRTIWCIHVEGWTTHNFHCHHMEKPESWRQCFKVCDWHQDVFEWEVSNWGACVIMPLFSNELKLRTAECITAQHGIQSRTIHCIRTSNRTTVTSKICELFSQKPPMEQACLTPCPQDCVVSDFTSWSSCSKTCGGGLQHRTRHILATPMYGGANCQNLTETRTCISLLDCHNAEEDYQYSFKAGAWSECRVIPYHRNALQSGRTTVDLSSNDNSTGTPHPLDSHHHSHHNHQIHAHVQVRYPLSWELDVGYQTRHVRCTRSDGKDVMLSFCRKDTALLTFKVCQMPNDCQTSEWSSWSPCSKTCRSNDLSPGYRLRSRIMTQIPHGGGRQCPGLEEKEACNIIGDLLPKCPRYVWRTSDWGDCHILPLLSQQDQRLANVSSLCGGGIQIRKTFCVQAQDDSAPHLRKEVSRPVAARLCDGNQLPLAVQNCSIPCQLHCMLSQWSAWSSCLHEYCKEPREKKGLRKRIREMLWHSGSALGTCSHLTEFIPCEDPACDLWQVHQDGRCIPTKIPCGLGTVVQNLTCVTTEEGKACPPATTLEEWRICNDHPCTIFYWEASAWGPCMEDTSADLYGTSFNNGTSSCAVGVQSRKISCVKMHAGPVTNKRCSESSRPETSRPCLLPCKKDCEVTPFSEWTDCPSTCIAESASAIKQSRYRTIIHRPANGGQECPDTLYEERDCESLHKCPVYRWRTHKWHSCTLVPDSVRRGLSGSRENCGNGLNTRGLSCVGEDGESANMTECLRWAGPLPPQIRQCRVACKDDCILTAWSKFSECAGCGHSQTRKRALIGRSKKKEHCLNEKLHPLEEKQTCPCNEFLSQPYGNWSVCIHSDRAVLGSLQGWMSHWETKECGQGLRYRAVACIDHQGHLVNPALCTESGYIVEVCHIPCPLDCKLSDWSAWSDCSASYGSGLKTRSRWLREKAFNGGRPCPKLDMKNQAQVHEAVPCSGETSHYEWRIEPWSICNINTVDNLPACGEGVQSRKIRCVKRSTVNGDQRHVDDSLCDGEEMPPRAQVCYLACPDDCVTAPWGAWSNCPLQCDPGATRNRSRHILRLPASEDMLCPELVQTEQCVLNSTCYTYEYKVSEWSTCQLSDNAICGEGAQLRLLDCVRSDAKIVELRECEQLGLINKWRLFEKCVVECPINCLLSDWSPWADCSLSCGSQGHLVRTRRMLQEARQGGRPCPSQLTQTKPCPITPCYMWLLSDWSPCTVQGAECGEGLRRRNLSCVIHLGNKADYHPRAAKTELCGDVRREHLKQDMEQPCFVPCPGDCYLTEWSLWSSCQLTCLEGRSFESIGHQARSKAVIIQAMENQGSCPHQVFETQPCKGGKCYSYRWRAGGWNNNEREVWCHRSDGVNVTGGCFQQKKPARLRHCHPPCTKPFSHCTPSGLCGCERGYTEVMTSHGFLDYCTRTPEVDNNKKADVKTNSGRLKPGLSQTKDFYSEWSLHPVGPDGRVKLWVYAVTVVGFILIIFIIALSFLIWNPLKISTTSCPPQKPLTLAYDGDMDM